MKLHRHAGAAVPEVSTLKPGEDAAHKALNGKNGFLPGRLKGYKANRNDPTQPQVLSPRTGRQGRT